MKKIVLPVLVLLLSLVLVSAVAYPHAFYGNIIVGDGLNPDGKILVGKINGIATGSCTISGNAYDLIVVDPLGVGGKIKFYIDGEEADESFDFVTFEVTESNLNFGTIPSEEKACGNGVCDSNECAVCPVDCGISECVGNGRCDIEMDEDCSNSPGDCGVCEFCGDNICNNGETCSTCVKDCTCTGTNTVTNTGGGGGGGSTGGNDNYYGNNNVNTNPFDVVTISDDTNQNNEIKTIGNLNQEDSQPPSFFSRLTGAVIGGDGIGILIPVIFILAIVLIGVMIIIYLRKKRRK